MVGRPKVPEPRYPDPLPPAPERSDAETASLAEDQRSRFFLRGGRAASMLTGGTGAESGTGAARFLGGAART